MTQTSQRMYVCKASAGTGKTYTLAAHYIALLMNNVPSRNILAVTFTNKATAEMKQRIISYLNDIAHYVTEPSTHDFLDCVRHISSEVRHLPTFSDDEYSTKAKELLLSNMSHFDDLCICTIDSFLQTLLTGLAQAINQTAGFGIDLDSNHAITQAVDEVLTDGVNNYTDIQTAVVKCLNARMKNEEKWDLRPGLIQLIKELYKENVQEIRDLIPLVTAQHPEYGMRLEVFTKQLNAFTQQAPYIQLKEAFERIRPMYSLFSDETGGRNYQAFFRRCENVCTLTGCELAQLGNTDYQRLASPEKFHQLDFEQISLLREQIDIIHRHAPAVREAMLRRKVYREHLDNLLLAGYVVDRIQQDQRENNTVLLAETASTLIQALDQHDAQFILLKAGIRYKHIMLDEFQDTSSLQWKNFQRLIEEILSNMGGSALIVGDVKQSIYRWRNGNYEIMNNLPLPQADSQLHRYYNPQNLSRNFRSRREIVGFNLELFRHISQEESQLLSDIATMYDEGYSPERLEQYYHPKKTGGHVFLDAFVGGNSYEENRLAIEQLLGCMFTQMEDLLAHGYQKKDMLILCRTADEAKKVLRYFHQLLKDPTRFPYLYQAGKIISNDSFQLESSPAVNTLIAGLQLVAYHDEVARYYLLHHYPQLDIDKIEQLSIDQSFADLVEQIIRLTLCVNGGYSGSDIGHLNCLRDKIRSYISQYGSNVKDFLHYWEDKMHSDSIPAANSDDIRIMTIHSAKGLQAKNVFIPFCAWKTEQGGQNKNTLWCEVSELPLNEEQNARLPISFGKDMNDIPSLQTAYEDERIKQHIDALNLLYVACTRAEDNLYLLVFKSKYTGNSAGSWLTQYFSALPYEVGTTQYPETKKAGGTPSREPFSFEGATPIEATYQSDASQIHFRQSKTTQQMLRPSDSQGDNTENMAFGQLCHAILEQVQTAQDVDRVINNFYLRGAIPSQADKQQIMRLIHRLVYHSVAGEWFDGSWRLLREDTLLSVEKGEVYERRVDRAMIKGSEVVVLDYKFGKKEPKHLAQVRDYMTIMRQMGYSQVKGYLWYGFQGELEPVNE